MPHTRVKSAKQQALAALPRLRKVFPIKRAAMRFRFTVPDKERAQATLDMLLGEGATIEEQTGSEIVCTADPSVYRTLDKFAKDTSVQLEVVTMALFWFPTSKTPVRVRPVVGSSASTAARGLKGSTRPPGAAC